jgi:sugar fermentation stimulation protein A
MVKWKTTKRRMSRKKARCCPACIKQSRRRQYTHVTNRVARLLIEGNKVPGLESYSILAQEVRFGKSRLDFLLERNGDKMALEVKSCTLFDGSIAMFPDAVTLRGSRHLRELGELSSKGDLRGGILFIVHWPYAEYFIPEYHTDLLFAKNLWSLKDNLFIQAMAVGWGKDLSLSSEVRPLEIPWGLIEREAQDRGSYIVILRLKEDTRLSAGSFAGVLFCKGYYLYAGSAMNSLTKRIERHRRMRKKMFWHIDYLREKAEFCAALPIRTATSIECSIAKALKAIADWSMPGFGSSDCSCETHLFGMHQDPIHSPAFIKTLLYYRLSRLADHAGIGGIKTYEDNKQEDYI